MDKPIVARPMSNSDECLVKTVSNHVIINYNTTDFGLKNYFLVLSITRKTYVYLWSIYGLLSLGNFHFDGHFYNNVLV